MVSLPHPVRRAVESAQEHLRKYRLKRGIKKGFRRLYFHDYGTIEEANEILGEIYEALDEAESFNSSSSVSPIDVEKLERGAMVLELRVENEYYQGNIPVR